MIFKWNGQQESSFNGLPNLSLKSVYFGFMTFLSYLSLHYYHYIFPGMFRYFLIIAWLFMKLRTFSCHWRCSRTQTSKSLWWHPMDNICNCNQFPMIKTHTDLKTILYWNWGYNVSGSTAQLHTEDITPNIRLLYTV